MDNASADMIHMISQYLSPPDLKALALTNKRNYKIITKYDQDRLTYQQQILAQTILLNLKQKYSYTLETDRFRTHRYFLLYLCRFFKSVLILTRFKKEWLNKLKEFNYDHVFMRKNKPKKLEYQLIIYDFDMKVISNNYNSNSKEISSKSSFNTERNCKTKVQNSNSTEIRNKINFNNGINFKTEIQNTSYNINLKEIKSKPSFDTEINFKRICKYREKFILDHQILNNYNCTYWYGLNGFALSCKLKHNIISFDDHYVIINQKYRDEKNMNLQPDLIVIERFDLKLITYIWVKYVLKSKIKKPLKIIFFFDSKSEKLRYSLNLIANYDLFEAELINFMCERQIKPSKEIIEFIYHHYNQNWSLRKIYHAMVSQFNLNGFKPFLYNRTELRKKKLSDLRLICKNKHLKGYSRKGKADLIEIILSN